MPDRGSLNLADALPYPFVEGHPFLATQRNTQHLTQRLRVLTGQNARQLARAHGLGTDAGMPDHAGRRLTERGEWRIAECRSALAGLPTQRSTHRAARIPCGILSRVNPRNLLRRPDGNRPPTRPGRPLTRQPAARRPGLPESAPSVDAEIGIRDNSSQRRTYKSEHPPGGPNGWNGYGSSCRLSASRFRGSLAT